MANLLIQKLKMQFNLNKNQQVKLLQSYLMGKFDYILNFIIIFLKKFLLLVELKK